MRTRHRIPSIFNLSMVDVLCCALGCVILLWLLNLREARQRAQQVFLIGEELTAAIKERDQLYLELRAAEAHADDLERSLRSRQAQLEDAAARLADVRDRLAKTQAERDAARKQAAERDRELAALKGQKAETEVALALKAREYTDLEKKRAEADRRIAALEGQLRDKDALLAASARKADALQALADQLPGFQKDAKNYREKAESEGARVRQLEADIRQKIKELAETGAQLRELEAGRSALEKDLAAARDRGQDLEARLRGVTHDVEGRRQELADAGQRLLDLSREKRALESEAVRLRAAADNRFAGITLTGKRVLFLVDMSGSMDLVDETTPAPKKWPGVRETVAKVMKSLPELEKFQVILFAEKVTFLLGNEGGWLDYDPRTSSQTVYDALARTRPDGGTNMYVAMQAAFGYRSKGLDTIYLLSDGLPNMGEGLPPGARNLREMERSEYLSKYIRNSLKTLWNRPADGRRRVRINTIGFFYESPDVGAFLWALARENDGSFVGMSQP
jgi:predicted  nucleic acid-binding Zn-ribbon protein